MQDNGEFTEITVHEGTNTIARIVLHPSPQGGDCRLALAPFADHIPLGWALLTAASALMLPPEIQVRLLVSIELLGAMANASASTGDTAHQGDESIPF